MRYMTAMDDLFNDFFTPTYRTRSVNAMKTDITETDENYVFTTELPGVKKENITLELKDGYLTIGVHEDTNNEEKAGDGKLIRSERYHGACSRSFWIGEDYTEEDLHAAFDNGELTVTMPKNAPEKVENKHLISIA